MNHPKGKPYAAEVRTQFGGFDFEFGRTPQAAIRKAAKREKRLCTDSPARQIVGTIDCRTGVWTHQQ
jgi:hypothetical protein